MLRTENLQWSKDRAFKYLDEGNINESWTSFMSDMSKHPENASNPAMSIGMQML